MSKYKEKIGFVDKYLIWIITIGPLFTQYVAFVDFILLPELLIMPLIPIYLFKKNRIKTQIFKQLLLYLYLVVFLTLLVILIQQKVDISIAITAFIRFLFYVLIIIFMSTNGFKIDYGSKIVVAVATFNSLYGVIQYVSYTYLGKVLPWHFKFLSVKYGTKLLEQYGYYFSEFGYRFSGLFSEPAHFSQYISFALIIVLFYKSENFNLNIYIKSGLVGLFSFVMILNGSGTGFAMLLFCFSLLIMKKIQSKNRNEADGLIKFFMITIILIGVFFVVNSKLLSNGYNRLISFSEVSTSNIRIFRPFEVYNNLPFINKIIGVGYANYSTYVFNSGIASSYELMVSSAWTNTLGYILVGSGIIGFFAYSMFYIKLLRLTRGYFRYLVLLLIVFAVFTEVPLSFQFVMIMSFVVQGIIKFNDNEIVVG